MKKVSFLLMAVFVSALFFYSSCDKEITTTEYTIDTTKTAVITIQAYANIDETDIGYEAAPSGTQFVSSVPKNNFVAGGISNIVETHTIIENGTIELRLPVDDNGVTYTISPQDFVYDQVQNGVSHEQTISKLFRASAQNITLKTNEAKTLQFIYNESQQWDVNEMIELSGYFTGNFNDTTGTDTLSSAQTILFHSNGWSTEVTSNANGSFSVEVPKSTTINYSCNIVINKVVFSGGEYVLRPYRYKVVYGTVPSSNSIISIEDISVYLGNGTAIN